MTSQHLMTAATRYAEAFSRLQPDRIDQLVDLVHDEVIFADPFNRLRGKASFRQVFAHMFEVCDEPRFQVSDIASGQKAVYLRWRMTGRLRSWPRTEIDLEGMSEITINADGLITAHIDHWDSASQLLSKLPGIGLVMKSMLRLFRLPPGTVGE
ncbi:nuclear transport factor 2 family protein [Alphaproteobacteria bacterium LSUCC0684]